MHSVVQDLYNHSPRSIFYEGAYKETPLHLACEHGHPGIANFILESNPDVNVNVRYAACVMNNNKIVCTKYTIHVWITKYSITDRDVATCNKAGCTREEGSDIDLKFRSMVMVL